MFLVGAGPGDPGLLTLRGRACLGAADLILYDALAHPDLLNFARPGAEQVFVGKRAGAPSERQTRINERLREGALAGKQVIRLKGGDPYLFGRGSEEAEFLAEHGIPFEVVPGVPSPLAATAYAGISLTHRKLSSSIAYVTATESPDKPTPETNWSALAQGPETLVIFMGVRRLATIARDLIAGGRPPETPAVVVQWASLPKQRTVSAPLHAIADAAEREGIGMPAITVIGSVVSLRERLRWYDVQPLFGKRILITRPAHQTQAMAEALRSRGAEPVIAPAITVRPLASARKEVPTLAAGAPFAWLIFTSANGVGHYFDALDAAKLDARALGSTRIACIGPKTAEALNERGLRANLIPGEYRGEAVAEALTAALGPKPARVWLARAKEARDVLPDTLRDAGHQVHITPLYESVLPDDGTQARMRALIAEGTLDAVTFTSSSCASNFAQIMGTAGIGAMPLVASIGPITTATAEKHGMRVVVEANPFTTDGLVDALEAHFTP